MPTTSKGRHPKSTSANQHYDFLHRILQELNIEKNWCTAVNYVTKKILVCEILRNLSAIEKIFAATNFPVKVCGL